MPLAALQFSLYREPYELGSVLAVLKNGVDAVKRSLRETCRGLLVVDLLPTHAPKIDDITNCYKPYFCGYHLLTLPRLMISSTHQQREMDMTTWKQNPDLIARLTKAQNAPANQNIDIMTFAGFCDTREELERHVEYYEKKAGA